MYYANLFPASCIPKRQLESFTSKTQWGSLLKHYNKIQKVLFFTDFWVQEEEISQRCFHLMVF